jgi:hypothetical protein
MVHLFPWMIVFELHRNQLLAPTRGLGETQWVPINADTGHSLAEHFYLVV